MDHSSGELHTKQELKNCEDCVSDRGLPKERTVSGFSFFIVSGKHFLVTSAVATFSIINVFAHLSYPGWYVPEKII